MSIPVITISREYGSGGRAIGEKLAKELGIPFYNKELILMAAKESGLSEEYIKKAEQQKSTSFLYGLYMGAQQLPMNDQIFLIQSKIIREIAEKGGIDAVYLSPVLKCIGIGMITHLAAQVCRDAQQGSIASAVELCGTLCALYISLPLIRSLLAIVEQLL